MKLPFLDLFKKKVPANYFLALLFRDEKIHAVVFEEINNHIQVIGEGKADLPTSVDTAADEVLLNSADKAISIAEEALPSGIQTHKTVLGVKETWVEDAHITKDYLAKLKTISDQLDLKPIGFLVFPEAIAHLLQKEEGAPVSAILVEEGQKQVGITLLRAGRITDSKEVPLVESVIATVENALKEFSVEILPSRIILFDSGSTKMEKEFLQHRWSKSLPFLHVPQITTLPSDFDTRAILFGTSSQMGFDAIDVIKQPVKKAEDFTPESFGEENVILGTQGTPESDSGQADEVEAPSPQPSPKKGEGDQGDENIMEVVGEDTSEYFGFVKDADVAQSATPAHTTPLASSDMDAVTEDIPEREKEEELEGEALGFSISGPIFFEGAKKTMGKLKRFMPGSFSIQPLMNFFSSFSQKIPGGGNKIIFLIPLTIVLFVVGFFWLFFTTKATVTLLLNPKTIAQDQSITFTTTGTTDPSQNLVAARSISIDEEGKVSGNASGTKDIGNPAKGSVTVFNSDSASHTLSSGTTITSSNGLTFTLDSSVTVASGSSDPTNLTAGTATVNVTASAIGTDGNLPSGTKFTIAGTSVLAAKNDTAFSGGTKQSITVVSQKDIDGLTAQLTDNLKDKAKADLGGKIQSDEIILPDFTKTTAGITNFDKKLNDQASGINLDGTITYETLAYKKADIESYSKAVLHDKLPANLTLSPNGITYSVKDMTTKGDSTKVTLTMQAQLIPQIDTTTLAGQITGKSLEQARDILSAVPQFTDATFAISPNLFFLSKSLPHVSSNIHIVVATHE